MYTAQVRPGEDLSEPRPQAISVDRVTHRFSQTLALDDVSLDVGRGEFVALLGPVGLR